MRVGSNKNSYDWVDGWAKTPDSESARTGWAHHGIVVTEAGNIITFHQGDPTVLVFDKDGNLQRSWDADLVDAHGMTLVKDDGVEYLWIADNGEKAVKTNGDYEYQTINKGPQVVKMSLDGQTIMNLQRPDLSIYRDGTYAPTWVAVNEERHGGIGDIWVADGYGESYIHRYDKTGHYLSSINGEEGKAGAFDCPHAIFIDRRKSEPELYIADRSNSRVQVYDLEGSFKRSFGSDFLTSPGGFVTHGELLIIAELKARLAILDLDDHLVYYLGDNEAVCDVDGWPNVKNERGDIVRTNLLEPGKFNSPHGMTVDNDGNLYVAEWLIGGRHTKLARL